MADADALLDALFAHAPVGLAFWDAELRFRRVNEELAAINGLAPAEHIGHLPSEILPELGERLEAVMRDVLAHGEPVRDLEITGETPSAPGVVRHWIASYLPVHAGGDEPIGVVALVVESTGERAATLRAASIDAELSALTAASPFGVAILDSELRYRRVNDALARMNGRPAAEHIGLTLEEVLGAPAAQLRPALENVIATREPLELEATVELPDDPRGSLTFAATYFPVMDDEGSLLGLGGVVADVTDRHRLEIEQSRLLREALVARAHAEAAQVRADGLREEAEQARADAERGRDRVAFLAEAGREMAASLDWETTLRTVVRIAVPRVADSCALSVVEPNGRLRVVAVTHADPDREQLAQEIAERDAAPGGLAAQVARSAEPEIARDRVVVPLRTAGRVLGTLAFHLRPGERAFVNEDLDLMSSLAARAALHMENARLFAERTHIARTLQAGLRPRALPPIPGADVAARFLPSGDQNEVGGDFYDVFPSGDGVWTVIVGDVAGKGPEAAAVTALARHTLRAASLLHDDPAANLALLNRVLYEESGDADFCTVFYARICPGDKGLDLRFANGGHPPPLVLRAGGAVETMSEGAGQLVGALPHARFGEATLHLAPGDLLLSYTDGVTEVRKSDLLLGERELRTVLAEQAGAGAEQVVAAVEQRAVDLQPGPPRDDIALVAVRALAPEG